LPVVLGNICWLYVPIVMRVLCQAIVVPPRSFFSKFDIPRLVRKELFFNAPDSRQALRDMYGDVRMLCEDVGLMNPFALLLWRICKINGQRSTATVAAVTRDRSEDLHEGFVT